MISNLVTITTNYFFIFKINFYFMIFVFITIRVPIGYDAHLLLPPQNAIPTRPDNQRADGMSFYPS